ncbi:hypothetical protein ES705_49663 [subsurface metagenome]
MACFETKGVNITEVKVGWMDNEIPGFLSPAVADAIYRGFDSSVKDCHGRKLICSADR